MRLTMSRGRRLSPLLFAIALLGSVAAANAGSWGPDYNISGGDVNDTFTSTNAQRFAVVNDTNDLYIAFYDDRNKTGQDDNFEIYFRRFIFGFGSPTITRVTNAPNKSKNPALATLNWGPGDAGTVNDSGRIYITWQDSRLYAIPTIGDPISWSIYFRTFTSQNGTGFGPEIQVSPLDSLNIATSPSITCGDSTHVWIVYPKQDFATSASSLWYAQYNPITKVMSPEQLLVAGATTASSPTIAATRDGVVHVVWSDNRTGRLQLWTKRWVPASGWTADQQIVFSSNVAAFPSIAATYTGHVHLVWRDNRDGQNEIYYKEYIPGVGWDTDPAHDTRLTVNSFSQLEPQVDADPKNNAYVVWSDQRNGGFTNQDIYERERIGGVWQSELSLVGATSDTTNSTQQFPGLIHDGLGRLYVTWTDWRLPSSSGQNKDVYYKVGTNVVTAVESTPAPLSKLFRNYPNPFNPSTSIVFRLERDAPVVLRVYDVRGRLVRTLVDGQLAAGRRTVTWDGLDARGLKAATGTYYLKLQSGATTLSRTINLLK
jgi:FlgD Ig-like domain